MVQSLDIKLAILTVKLELLNCRMRDQQTRRYLKPQEVRAINYERRQLREEIRRCEALLQSVGMTDHAT